MTARLFWEEFRTAFPKHERKAFVVIDKMAIAALSARNGVTEFIEGRLPEGHAAGKNARRRANEQHPWRDPMIPPPDSNDLPAGKAACGFLAHCNLGLYL